MFLRKWKKNIVFLYVIMVSAFLIFVTFNGDKGLNRRSNLGPLSVKQQVASIPISVPSKEKKLQSTRPPMKNTTTAVNQNREKTTQITNSTVSWRANKTDRNETSSIQDIPEGKSNLFPKSIPKLTDNGKSEETNLTLASPEDVALVYEMLDMLDKLFYKYNIKYWIERGTLLGAVRHQGLIPWDDDADLTIFKQDEYIFRDKEFLKEIHDVKFELIFFGSAYKIFPQSGKKYKNNPRRPLPPFVDIFLVDLNRTGIKPSWPKCDFLMKDVLPLKRYQFGHLMLNGPNSAKGYLDSCYGPNWVVEGSVRWDHKNGMEMKPRKLNLTKFGMVPPGVQLKPAMKKLHWLT